MTFKLSPAVFLDRDGVINVDKEYLHKIDDFEFLPGVLKGCRKLAEHGYKLIVVTNQSGIARGFYTEDDLAVLHEWMAQQFAAAGAPLTAIEYSPYHPEATVAEYKRNSLCRKPHPGMLLRAATYPGIDLRSSIIVGDKASDLWAGHNAELCECIWLSSGKAKEDEIEELATAQFDSFGLIPDYLFKKHS